MVLLILDFVGSLGFEKRWSKEHLKVCYYRLSLWKTFSFRGDIDGTFRLLFDYR